MPSCPAPEAAGPEPVRSPRAQLIAMLTRRIAAGRTDTSPQRDPDFVRKMLPAIDRYTGYFTSEIRGLDRVPADGPALLVGNHSGLFYMPEVWTCGQVLVYPGGDLEACRPWTQRNKVDFAGRKGFVRLALRCGVPVVWLGIVACQAGTAFAVRTDHASLRQVGLFSNKLLLAGIAVALAFAAALVYLPALHGFFGTAALSPGQLAIVAPFPFIVWGADEIRRALIRRRSGRRPA